MNYSNMDLIGVVGNLIWIFNISFLEFLKAAL